MIFRRTLALVAGLAAAAALAGCSSAAPGTGASPSATLTLAIQTAPVSMDATQLDYGQDTIIWNSVYDTLLRMGPDGNPLPEAATSYRYNAARTELTLELRAGMKFSNGDAVTAADVVAGIKRLLAAKNVEVAAVESVTAPDARTIRIDLSRPDPNFLAVLSRATGVITDPATVSRANAATDPIGSGPYILETAATTNGSVYTLRKNPAFWDASAFPYKTVVVKVIADETAAADALRSGQIDSTVILPNQVSELKGAGATIQALPGNGWVGLYLADRGGSKLPALGSLKVRQAINMAFDRQAIVTDLLRGYGETTEQILGPKTPGYVPALNDTYPYDVAKAKALMAQAGYAKGFTLTLPSFAYLAPLQPVVSQELGAIGITVVWQSLPPSQFVPRLLAQDYPAFFFLNGIASDANDTATQIAPTGALNPFHSADPALTALLKQAALAPGDQAAASVYQRISTFTVQQAWFAPIFDLSLIYASDSKISWTPPGPNSWATLRNYAPAQ